MSTNSGSQDIVMADVVYRDGLNRKYLRPEDLRRLSHADFSSRRAIEGLYSGKHKTLQRGQSIEFRDYRQYLPGDEINHVDWKVFGRTDKLFIKLFEHQADLTVHLLVDASHSMFFNGFDRQGGDTKYDCCCRLAAAIAFLITKQHDRFSFGVAQNGLHAFHQPGGNLRFLMKILDSMEGIKPTGDAKLAQSIDDLVQFSKKRDLLCIFSDLLDEQGELLKKMAVWMQRGGEVIVFQVMHEHEIELPDLGAARFIDSESREQMRVDVNSVRRTYNEKIASFISEWSSQCSKLGVDYNLVKVNTPYTSVLQKYFAQRNDRLASRGRQVSTETDSNSEEIVFVSP